MHTGTVFSIGSVVTLATGIFLLESEPTQFRESWLRDLGLPESPKKMVAPKFLNNHKNTDYRVLPNNVVGLRGLGGGPAATSCRVG